jgi:diacylglycerol kinase (ATP)
MKIAPNAQPDDGILDITVVHQLSKLKLLLVFISVFWGKHIHFKEVKIFKGETASIHSSSALFVHADGETIGFTPLDIQVITKKLHVVTRRKSRGESTQKVRSWNDIR